MKAAPNRRTTLPRLFSLIPLALVSACSQQDAASPLPQEIHGMKLVRVSSGQEAAAMIARLHRKQVAPAESYIGHYGSGPVHGMLYVSRFESEEQAQSVLMDMSTRFGEGSSGFGHHKTFSIDGRQIHLALGQGQVHFFFTRGAYLSWLGVAPGMERAALAQLLELEVERIPSTDSLLSDL